MHLQMLRESGNILKRAEAGSINCVQENLGRRGLAKDHYSDSTSDVGLGADSKGEDGQADHEQDCQQWCCNFLP